MRHSDEVVLTEEVSDYKTWFASAIDLGAIVGVFVIYSFQSKTKCREVSFFVEVHITKLQCLIGYNYKWRDDVSYVAIIRKL